LIARRRVKHAGADALDRLGALLASLRAHTPLREKRPGIFYVKGRPFLHFHADRAGLFADLRQGDDWQRLPVGDPADCQVLLDLVDRTLEPAKLAESPEDARLPPARRQTRLG
jgi:hypothetical protein